ncbi:MAG TPA: hypothetical protein VLB27_02160, partial [candidate division Zixibacteria bacterium]|nr:hypothetical protein [candidate division Zixibacteria bacterium]
MFAGTAVLSLAGLWIYRRCYVDDAYITLRFCRNWLAGHGVVWNIGERVEGYSNFLYLALTTAVGWFGVDIVAASRIVSLAAYIALFLFVVWWIGRATRRTRVSLTETVTLSLFALTLHPLLIWTVAGLEGALFVLWLTVAVWLFAGALAGEGRGTLIGVAFALATMT